MVSAQASMSKEMSPPMLPKASFFMLIMAPCDRENISRAMSRGVASA